MPCSAGLTLFAVALASGCATPPPVAGASRTGSRRVELQGHRGARGLAPENTLVAFDLALRLGVDTLELDVHLTRDDRLVVHHDDDLNPDSARGPDGSWVAPGAHRIRDLTLAELERFDLSRVRPGSPSAQRFPRERAPGPGPVRVPTLAQVIALGESRGPVHSVHSVHYNIETKIAPDTVGTTPAELVDPLIAAIRAAGIQKRATIQSFDWRTLVRARRLAPEIATSCLTHRIPDDDTIGRGRPGPSPWTAGLDVDDVGGSVPRLVAGAGCAIWSPDLASLEPGEVAEAHRLGLRVITWTVDEPADLARAIDLGVDGIITDFPDRARQVMRARGLPLPPPRPPRP